MPNWVWTNSTSRGAADEEPFSRRLRVNRLPVKSAPNGAPDDPPPIDRTLSGARAQRIKLASFLSESTKSDSGRLFLFDEPTTGLHHTDVAQLIKTFRNLHSSASDIERSASEMQRSAPELNSSASELDLKEAKTSPFVMRRAIVIDCE